MKENTLEFCSYSNTIRQMPQNYMIAYKADGSYQHWKCDADIACDKKLAVKVFLALFDFYVRYGSGENLIKVVENENL